MLRSCAIYIKDNLHDNLPFIEFDYNNSYMSSIVMSPFMGEDVSLLLGGLR